MTKDRKDFDDPLPYSENPPWTMFFDGPLYQRYKEFMANKDFSQILLTSKLKLANQPSYSHDVPDTTVGIDWWSADQDGVGQTDKQLEKDTYNSVSDDFYRSFSRGKKEEKRRTRRTRAIIFLIILVLLGVSLGTALIIHYFFVPPDEDQVPAQVNISFSGNTSIFDMTTETSKDDDDKDAESKLDDVLDDKDREDHDLTKAKDKGDILDPGIRLFDDVTRITTDATTSSTQIGTSSTSQASTSTTPKVTSFDPDVFFALDENITETTYTNTTEVESTITKRMTTTIPEPSVSTTKAASTSLPTTTAAESTITTSALLTSSPSETTISSPSAKVTIDTTTSVTTTDETLTTTMLESTSVESSTTSAAITTTTTAVPTTSPVTSTPVKYTTTVITTTSQTTNEFLTVPTGDVTSSAHSDNITDTVHETTTTATNESSTVEGMTTDSSEQMNTTTDALPTSTAVLTSSAAQETTTVTASSTTAPATSTTTILETTTEVLPHMDTEDTTTYKSETAQIRCRVTNLGRFKVISINEQKLWSPVSATLYSNMSLQWSNSKTDRYNITYNFSNVTGSYLKELTFTLLISNVECKDSGEYKCVIKTFANEVSKQAKLTVVGRPDNKIQLKIGPSIVEKRALRITAIWQAGYPKPWTNMSWTALDADNQTYNLADYGEYRDYELREDHYKCQTFLETSIVIFPRVHLNDTTVIVKPNLETTRLFLEKHMKEYLESVEYGVQKILVIPLNYCQNGSKDMSIPHPYTSCTKFIRCLPGDLVVQQCPMGTCFIQEREECL